MQRELHATSPRLRSSPISNGNFDASLLGPKPATRIHSLPQANDQGHTMITALIGRRARTTLRTRSRRPLLEPLEDRMVLDGNPPFAVGGDPSVNPASFRITTFASGLNY